MGGKGRGGRKGRQGSHSLTDKKLQDFYRTFQGLNEKFSRTFSVPTNA